MLRDEFIGENQQQRLERNTEGIKLGTRDVTKQENIDSQHQYAERIS